MQNTVAYNAQLQERDVLILRGLFESRIMTLEHIAALYFQRRHEAAKKRCQKLKSAGLIAERPRRSYEPSILFLTNRALMTLASGGHLSDYPALSQSGLAKRSQVSPMTLDHEIELLDIKAAMVTAVAEVRAL